MIPFMTEEIYQNLVRSVDANAPESIHLCDFPEVKEAWIDTELEDNMDELVKIVGFGRARRDASGVKNRQPIAQMYIRAEQQLDEFYREIIAGELNVKKVDFVDDVSAFTTYNFKPQLRTVGPKYGKFLKGIQEGLAALDGNKAYAQLQADGFITLPEVDASIKLAEEDLLITMTQQEGYVTDGDNSITVVLDMNLTPELIEEGFVREIISKIQNMRKEAGFEVMDHIEVGYEADDKVSGVFASHSEEIASVVLADSITSGLNDGFKKDLNINGESVSLSVRRR
jgi:isoleucyl-tRNA synthetase